MDTSERSGTYVDRIANAYPVKAQYNLTVCEQKIIAFLVSNLDPQREDFGVHVIPIQDFEMILEDDMHDFDGSWTETWKFTRSLFNEPITFPVDLGIDGQRPEGYINWFSSVAPERDDGAIVGISFSFTPELHPLLLKLTELERSETGESRLASRS